MTAIKLSNIISCLCLVVITKGLGQEFKPDSSINNNIGIMNSLSIIERFGYDIKFKSKNDNLSFPMVQIYNSDTTEKLTLIRHFGSSKYEVSKIILEKKSTRMIEANYDCIILKDSIFITSNNICLNMKVDCFLKIFKGQKLTKKLNDKYILYIYKLDDFDSNCFLKRYNMPIYIAEYEFINNNLTKISFGFEYP